jgi:hypothetical protein
LRAPFNGSERIAKIVAENRNELLAQFRYLALIG